MQDTNIIQTAKAQMRKGVIEFCTLLVIAKGKVYVSDIVNELKKADLLVVEGTLYPLLSRLKSEEMVAYSWEESKGGPPRKYYTLTDKGKNTLEILKQSWNQLSKSIKLLTKYE